MFSSLLPYGQKSFQNEVYSSGKNVLPDELTHTEKGGKYQNGRVASPDNVPISLVIIST